MQWQLNGYEVDTDADRIDLDRIHAFLQETYWAAHRTRAEIEMAWRNSNLLFGLYCLQPGHPLVGCARVVTDGVTFGWLADVYVDPRHRGRGLGKFLLECVTHEPLCKKLTLFHLGTRDAHGLYRQYGWETLPANERWMLRATSESVLTQT